MALRVRLEYCLSHGIGCSNGCFAFAGQPVSAYEVASALLSVSTPDKTTTVSVGGIPMETVRGGSRHVSGTQFLVALEWIRIRCVNAARSKQ